MVLPERWVSDTISVSEMICVWQSLKVTYLTSFSEENEDWNGLDAERSRLYLDILVKLWDPWTKEWLNEFMKHGLYTVVILLNRKKHSSKSVLIDGGVNYSALQGDSRNCVKTNSFKIPILKSWLFVYRMVNCIVTNWCRSSVIL